jgi:DNA-binding FadR family transcriptional regulator
MKAPTVAKVAAVGSTGGTTVGERRRGALYVPKVAELIAGDLRSRIIGGELADGAELPRESDLVEDFAVSRTSVREALRILETEGLLRIRRGKLGGAIVKRPTAASAAYHLGLTLVANGVTHDDLAAARLSIEPICAGLAAELPERHKVVDELGALIEASEACTTNVAFTAAAHDFHLRLTERCGNTTMTLLAGTLEAVWNAQEDRIAWSVEDPEDPPSRRASIEAHRRLVDAIEAGEPERARAEMHAHLSEVHELMIAGLGTRAIELTAIPAASACATLPDGAG